MSAKYYDIGFNLTDDMFRGLYHGKKYHESDISNILTRAYQRNVKTVLVTGSSIEESREVIKLIQEYQSKTPINLYHTIGVHPCCVNEFVQSEVNSGINNPTNNEEMNQQLFDNMDIDHVKGKLKELFELVQANIDDSNNSLRAIGEIGLDYSRLHYSCKDLQKLLFEEQLKLSCLIKNDSIPLFLHMRNCGQDFIQILKKFIIGFLDTKDLFNLKSLVHEQDQNNSIFYKFNPNRKFVVHSFTDSLTDLKDLLNLSPNCYIGMNGASFRETNNIECVKYIPLDRLLLETDAPWCEIKRTHEAWKYLSDRDKENKYKLIKKDKLKNISKEEWDDYMIKGRNEPCTMENVAKVISNVKQLPLEKVIDTVWQTSCNVYGE
ncbi:hypothetical protein RI543_003342 [Arxiozyma heterogenica]|uniref:Uncharacterized protein n=2 Tax=Arxiozyma heterogenica TaxID=278026 RepID=A0AAN7W232_9SACH|nr:hypothetical protein RI543_003342 [Kazachstania heterogenica]